MEFYGGVDVSVSGVCPSSIFTGVAAHQHDPAEQRALFSLVCLIPYVCFSLSNITGQKAWRSAAKVGFRQCFSVEHQGCHVVFIWLFKANNVYAYTKCKPLYSVL